MLATAQRTLKDSPPAFVEIALQNIDGSIDFFKTAAPSAFAGVADPALQQAIRHVSNTAAVKALDRVQDLAEAGAAQGQGQASRSAPRRWPSIWPITS